MLISCPPAADTEPLSSLSEGAGNTDRPVGSDTGNSMLNGVLWNQEAVWMLGT